MTSPDWIVIQFGSWLERNRDVKHCGRGPTRPMGAALVRLPQRAAARPGEKPMKIRPYQRITNRIVADLEQGLRS